MVYNLYRFYDDLNNTIPIIVPAWTPNSQVNVVSETWKKISEYINDYPTCPFEGTWFVAGNTNLTLAQNMGFANVYDITQLTSHKWYPNKNDTTIYMEFKQSTSPSSPDIYYVFFVTPHGREDYAFHTGSDYSSASCVLGSMFSDTVGANGTQPTWYTEWIITGIRADNGGEVRNYSNRVSQPSPLYPSVSSYNILQEFWSAAVPYTPETDPYQEIPPAETGGAGGTYVFNQSDDIDYPSLPSLSAVTTGFISLWAPTEAQMLTLSEYMWNADILTVDYWKKLVADPLQLIYGLNIIPLDLHNMTPAVIDNAQNVVIGIIDTKIPMDHLNTQWVELDCGSITIDETWGAYLDYDPYTKLEIYLPYCGTHPLKVDDFMPGSISVKYHIDLLTGSCVAMVKSTKSSEHGDILDSVVYQFMGNCAAQIPVTASQYADAVRSAISIAASIGSMVAVGVGGAASSAGALMGGTSKTAGKRAARAATIEAHTAGSEIHTGASAVENVMNLKPSIERSGAIGSSGGMLAIQTPYLILTRPRQARPESQNIYTGYPSFITETLGDLNGWTIVQAIHLDNIPCTSEELDEIDGLLKAGVIF